MYAEKIAELQKKIYRIKFVVSAEYFKKFKF